MFDDVDDMGIFNMPWGDDFGFPPPPGAPPPGFQIPLPPPGLAAPAMPPLAAARPGGGMFENRFRRHPGEQPPQLGLEQDIDWRNPAGVPPLPEYRAAVDGNQGRLAALQERMTDRTRLRRAEAVKNEAQPENDLHAVAVRQHIEQAKAARQLALGQQARQARAAREMVLPNIVLPEAPQPLPRQVLSAAVANAVAAREARDAERRRRLEEQVGKAAVNLRMERLREIAQKNERNNEDENKRRLREQMDRIQALQDRARAIGQDGGEDVRPRNERLERLRQRLVNQSNANNEASGSNEDGNNAAADDGPPLLRGTYYRIRRSEQAPAALPQPAAALRQQQILDHEERRIERSQLMARLRREQENDEAATAKRLARLRQNGAAAAVQSPRHRQGQVFELLSPSPEVKKKARLFDMADEADDEEDEDEDEEW
ncbi:hypothetical protein BGZ57DRAFT_879553 [Hyaloscypha finlandica]|nr:hypothetical protein BGZ57DRAFT_879553 [Hyaloscypha finlandica]